MSNTYPERTRIEQYMTKTTWLHFQDALEIGKLHLFAGQYTKGQGSKLCLSHYVDALTIRPLLHDLSWGKAVHFVDYKGTDNHEQTTSRVLRVNSKEDKVYWSLVHGPGTPTKTGAVMPQRDAPDDAKQKLNISMDRESARAIAYSVLEYLLAYRTHTLITDKMPRRVISPQTAVMTLDDINSDLGLPPISPVSDPPEAAAIMQEARARARGREMARLRNEHYRQQVKAGWEVTTK